jgi:hypothetical protein
VAYVVFGCDFNLIFSPGEDEGVSLTSRINKNESGNWNISCPNPMLGVIPARPKL